MYEIYEIQYIYQTILFIYNKILRCVFKLLYLIILLRNKIKINKIWYLLTWKKIIFHLCALLWWYLNHIFLLTISNNQDSERSSERLGLRIEKLEIGHTSCKLLYVYNSFLSDYIYRLKTMAINGYSMIYLFYSFK